MNMIIQAVRQFAADEGGVTAIEYGLIAAVIAGAIASVVTGLGTSIKDTFTAIKTSIGG